MQTRYAMRIKVCIRVCVGEDSMSLKQEFMGCSRWHQKTFWHKLWMHWIPARQHYSYITCFLGTFCAVFCCFDHTLSFSFSVSLFFELWIYTSRFPRSNSHLNLCPRNMNWKILNTKEPLFSLGEGDVSRMLNKLAGLLFFPFYFYD